jgi:hypothetical protein
MSGSFQFHFNLAGAAAPIADQPALPAKRKIAAAAAAEDEGDDAIEVQEGGLEEAHADEIVEPAARQSPRVSFVARMVSDTN